MENMMTKHGIKNYETEAYCPWCEEVTKFEVAQECYCHVDFDGCGYTYQDEHGDCDFCMGEPFCCKGCQASFPKLPTKRGYMTKKKKNTVITDVYACISVERTSIGDLARALNEENARAFRLGKKMWRPVGGPIVRDFPGVDILVVREDQLDIDQ